MHIKADLGKCLAYANCVAAAPDVYDLDGSFVKVLEPNPSPELQAAARRGARQCPVKALTIEEETDK
jgi:ferredoxin